MIKNKIKLSLAAVMMLATTSYAGVVRVPNINNLEISGDAELKQVKEKTGDETVDKRTAEINLNLDAKSASGLMIHTTFKLFDGTQAGANTIDDDNQDDGFKTKEAFVKLPILGGKGKVMVGLHDNTRFAFGTDAFENGGESWKAAMFIPIAKGIVFRVVSKIDNEEEQDSNKGDSGATAARIDATFDTFKAGIKYAKGYRNKDDGKVFKVVGDPTQGLDTDNTEKKGTVGMVYLQETITGFNFGAEYRYQKVDLIGVNKTMKPKGYYLEASKSIDNLTVGLSYINLTKGMKGGEEFAPGLILDGIVDSSATEDTSAIILPIEYAIDDQISLNATYIDADMMGDDAKEFDLGASYAMDDNVELSIEYGKYTQDNADDQTNIEAVITVTF